MEQNQTRDEIEIDLRELFFAVWEKKILIVLAGIVFALGAMLASRFLLSEEYRSTTQIYIQNTQDSNAITNADLQSSTQLANDYRIMLKTREVAEQVLSNLNLVDMDAAQLINSIEVTTQTDARVLNIVVTHTEPYLARSIANEVREVGTQHVANVMKVEAAEMVSAADLPLTPSSPNVKRNALLGGVLGVALAIFVVLLIYILDDTIKTPDDVEKYLGTAVLGSIPLTEQTQNKKKKRKNNKVNSSKAKKKGGK